jgi:hypothetical protein
LALQVRVKQLSLGSGHWLTPSQQPARLLELSVQEPATQVAEFWQPLWATDLQSLSVAQQLPPGTTGLVHAPFWHRSAVHGLPSSHSGAGVPPSTSPASGLAVHKQPTLGSTTQTLLVHFCASHLPTVTGAQSPTLAQLASAREAT